METPHARTRSGVLRRLLLWCGAGGLILAATLGLLLALLHSSAVASRVRERVIPLLSHALGREVSIARTAVTWFPLAIELRDVRAAGGPGEAPLLVIPRARAALRLWPLLRSRGNQVELESLELRDPTATLVRRADGAWELPRPTPSPQPERSPPGERIDRLTLVNGTVHFIDRAALPSAQHLRVVDQVRLDAHGVGPGQVLTLSGEAAVASPHRNAKLSLRVAPVPGAWDALRAHPPQVRLQVALEGVSLEALGMPPSVAVGPGTVLTLHADLAGSSNGSYQGPVSLQLERLRNGHTDTATAAWTAALDVTRPGPLQVQLQGLQLRAPGVALGGRAVVQPAPLHVELVLAGKQLDLGRLRAAAPAQGAAGGPGRQRQPKTLLRQLVLSGTLALERLVLDEVSAEQVRTSLLLRDGIATLVHGRATVAGGVVTLDGSRVDLRGAAPHWFLEAKLAEIDLGRLERAVLGREPFTAQASGMVAFHGEATRWAQLRERLQGHGALAFHHPVLTEVGLGGALAQHVGNHLGQVGLAEQTATPAPATRGTSLEDFSLHFTVAGGWLRLTQPVLLGSDFGRASLAGRVGLDQRLELVGSATLAPAFLGSAMRLLVRPTGPLAVPLQVRGTLPAPEIHLDVGPEQLGKQLVSLGGQSVQGVGADVFKLGKSLLRQGFRPFAGHKDPKPPR